MSLATVPFWHAAGTRRPLKVPLDPRNMHFEEVGSDSVSTDEWGTLVTGASGWILFAAAIMLLVVGKRRSATYVTAGAYVMLLPIHLWFWQFELTSPQGVPDGTSTAL
jgi:hypothetical protein